MGKITTFDEITRYMLENGTPKGNLELDEEPTEFTYDERE